jgi:ATP-dependent Lon protease
MIRRRISCALSALVAAVVFSISTFAQEPVKQDAPARSRQTRPALKPLAGDTVEKSEPASQTRESDEAMRRTLTDLSTQINSLADELRTFRRESERTSRLIELLLSEDRLSKLEDKIQETADRKAQLDAREQEINRRMRNIPNELMLRGGLRRDEAEAAIRSELQRSLDDVHSQQATSQQRLGELNEQAARFRARAETLRKKLELLEDKGVKEEK